MIRWSLEWVFLAPVALGLTAIIAAWYGYNLRKHGLEKPIAEGTLFRCGSCGYVYVEESDRPGMECPKCGAYNDAIRR